MEVVDQAPVQEVALPGVVPAQEVAIQEAVDLDQAITLVQATQILLNRQVELTTRNILL